MDHGLHLSVNLFPSRRKKKKKWRPCLLSETEKSRQTGTHKSRKWHHLLPPQNFSLLFHQTPGDDLCHRVIGSFLSPSLRVEMVKSRLGNRQEASCCCRAGFPLGLISVAWIINASQRKPGTDCLLKRRLCFYLVQSHTKSSRWCVRSLMWNRPEDCESINSIHKL